MRGKGKETFEAIINELFSKKIYHYYYHLPKLIDFPDNYKLGFGNLHEWKSLPDSVQKTCKKVMLLNESPLERIKQETWEKLIQENQLIFSPPHQGCWLKIQKEGYFTNYMAKQADQKAEQSMNVLRYVLDSNVFEPFTFSIAYDTLTDNSSLSGNLTFSGSVEYTTEIDEEVHQFNQMIHSPNRMENRILHALDLLRIGDYIAEDTNQVFYYTAAIEKILLDNEPELGHKFAVRGTFLLSDESKNKEDMY